MSPASPEHAYATRNRPLMRGYVSRLRAAKQFAWPRLPSAISRSTSNIDRRARVRPRCGTLRPFWWDFRLDRVFAEHRAETLDQGTPHDGQHETGPQGDGRPGRRGA